MHSVTKTWGPERGPSVCFRNWKADGSHCRFLHGYALGISLTFGRKELDDRDWVIDFGGLKEVKDEIDSLFDHKLLIADDDPYKYELNLLNASGIAVPCFLPVASCEGIAKAIAEQVQHWLLKRWPTIECERMLRSRKWNAPVSSLLTAINASKPYLTSASVFEHSSNMATYHVKKVNDDA